MKRPLLIAGAAVAALALAACGQKAETDTAVVPAETAVVPAADVAPAAETTAQGFVEKAAASDMFEVEAGKLAQTKATNAEVKAFAEMMVKDHTKSTADLKKAIADSGQTITPPAAMPADMQAKLDALNASTTFDKDYMTGQVEAHQNTLTLLQGYAAAGDTPAIKTFAAATAPVVQGHLERARTLNDSLN